MGEHSAKYKQISPVRTFSFLQETANPFFPSFPVFSFRVCIFFDSMISQWMNLFTYSGLFNRQGLDKVYADFFVLLLSAPLSTARQLSVETLKTNRKAFAADHLAIPRITRSIMMFMIRKRKYTLSQTLLDGRQVGEISCTVNKHGLLSG